MCPTGRRARAVVAILLLSVCAQPLAADVVVSQIYGGGGNAGALLKVDFVELFNRGTVAQAVGGWSLQYASATASVWQVTPLSGTIQPGAYYLVQLGGGSGGSVDLPAPDAVGTTNMSAAAGKVALVDAVTSLGVACPNDPSIRDFVGYGTANCFEGSAPAPAGTNTAALLRADDGCDDTGDNAADFGAGTPIPRNQLAPIHLCNPLSPTETPTASPSTTPTNSVTASPTTTPSPQSTFTATPSMTPSPSETASDTPAPTSTDTFTPTETATASATSTTTPSSTTTSTPSPSNTPKPTSTDTFTPTETATASASSTTTSSSATTATPSPSDTPTPAVTASPTPSVPPVASATESVTPTATASVTPDATASDCGNAIVEPGEQCDDANDVDGDMCPNGCSYRSSGALIHGNHRLRTVRGDGCQVEWYVADTQLTRDAYDFAGTTQTCVDQDPGCDFDDRVNRCRFAVVVCVNNTDPALPDCKADGIGRSSIVHPPASRRSNVRSANRAALEHALSHLVDPEDPQAGPVNALPLSAGETDFCSRPFAIDVELQGAGAGVTNLIVDTFSTNGGGRRRERARLRLVCTS